MSCITVLFANAKGGVGKSTLAFLSAIYFAAKYDLRVCVIDFDRLRTTYNAARRFGASGVQHVYMGDHDWEGPNADLESVRAAIETLRRNNDVLFVDTPAGFPSVTLMPVIQPDLIFVPVAVSDADIMATRTYLPELKEAANRLADIRENRARITLVPNQVFSDNEALVIRDNFYNNNVRIAPALTFSRGLRGAFHFEAEDANIVSVFIEHGGFFRWIAEDIKAMRK
ncbi:ParA family protein [Alkalicaulis satelles]|uniref:ParA family protein n=1 Tax=Alkalicaulis satelles TaxID=2609175 RepID=A0A5M6ZNB5_9PROT|nr:ParA family protein [Alkalicaulis satelles]KAA5805405.1 ParA family protein [Alkalicaulis satelles]